MLLVGIPALFEEAKEHGVKAFLMHVPEAFVNWKDSPEAFFYVYMAGYLITWWNTGVGGLVLVMLAIVTAIVSRDPVDLAVFCMPVLVVGLLHLAYWNRLRQVKANRSLQLPPAAGSR
jgi:hypothetical protein